MIASHTVRSRSLLASRRLDARYFTSPGAGAQETLLVLESSGVDNVRLRDLGDIWAPSRFKREWAEPAEESLPYLRPYDIFEYRPVPSGHLSVQRTDTIDSLRAKEGVIVQTCSGRNLGPCVLIDEYLAGFALSHDLVRIELAPDHREYVLTYLLTSIGQALLRQGKSGSVIDHLTDHHVAAMTVPMLDQATRETAAEKMAVGTSSLAEARRMLVELEDDVAADFPEVDRTGSGGWTVRSSLLSAKRIDAAYFSPEVRQAREETADKGGVRLGEIADVWLPPRYKRYYVDPPQGRPILSGRQLLQHHPINLRHVSDRSFEDAESMVLRKGMTLLGGVGRAEGRIGSPALITDQRDGWLASNDVMRLTPRPGVSPGAVYLAMTAPAVQQQLAAIPYGSVVDHVYPDDLADLIVPDIDEKPALAVEMAWEMFELADDHMRDAVGFLEAALST